MARETTLGTPDADHVAVDAEADRLAPELHPLLAATLGCGLRGQ